ncbi:hypothetical protein WA026_005355 [Henosepilachna vigintioctopunctata]|uniref:Fibrous sheath-interacting protein 1 n=1 Tax=Henosepilachna vigintioctopunctata TaxID=420089 RepID=A0AAW1TSH2_9CUCU
MSDIGNVLPQEGTGAAGESLPTEVGCPTDSGGGTRSEMVRRSKKMKTNAETKDMILDAIQEEVWYTPDKERVATRRNSQMELTMLDLNNTDALKEERESLDKLEMDGERKAFLSRQVSSMAPGASTPISENSLQFEEEEDEIGVFSFLVQKNKRKRMELSSCSSEGSRAARFLGAYATVIGKLEEMLEATEMDEGLRQRLDELCQTMKLTLTEEQKV